MSVLFRLCLLSFLFLALTWTGCAKSDAQVCSVTADCAEGMACEEGLCEEIALPVCSYNEPCPDGFVCVDQSCVREGDGDGDSGDGDGGDQDPGDGDNEPGDNDGDGDSGDGDGEPVNPGSPLVESVHPADGASGVALDAQIRITFDRPIAHEFGRLTNEGVYLSSPDGNKVSASLDYRVDEREVILTPEELLWPGTRYTVHVTEFVRDVTEIYAAAPFQSVLYTEFNIDPDLQALAELYAPVIYQETRMTSVPEVYSDIPTRVDFDGDLRGDNNKANSLQAGANVPAHVYYSVVSTESHYFIHYILYYATRRLGTGTTLVFHEHDFTGFVVVVNRSTLEVDLIEGVHSQRSNVHDKALTYRPSGSPVVGRAAHENSIMNINRSDLDQGAGFPLYVPSGDHAGCFWHKRTSTLFPTACPDLPGEFVGGQGIILTFDPSNAQTYQQAVDSGQAGIKEMTYTLLPFIEPFWTQRGDFNCGLFGNVGFSYNPWSPDGYTPPTGPGSQPLYLPRRLCSNDSDESYGNLPYRWFGLNSNGGEWFLDPAMELNDRFDFGSDYSLNYCDNFFFNIDRSSDPACGGNGD